MLWRHVMVAVPNVDMLPTPVLDRAGRIARGLHAEVELFHSLYEPDIVQPLHERSLIEERIATRVNEQHRHIERIADALRDQGLTVHSSVHWDYPMYEGVVRQVLRHKPDLLIVPAVHTRDVASRTLAYREARLIEVCPCPLLLLKTLDVYSKGCIVAAVDPLHAYEVPQEIDETIIAAAKTVAYALADAPVRIYHAVAPLHQMGGDTNSAPGMIAPADAVRQGARRASAEARVRDIALRHGIPEDHTRVEFGHVETSLPAFAREVRPEVVVMGAVSRRFPHRAVFGHTAERVLGALDCDVLVVKPRGFRCPVPPDASPAVPRPT